MVRFGISMRVTITEGMGCAGLVGVGLTPCVSGMLEAYDETFGKRGGRTDLR